MKPVRLEVLFDDKTAPGFQSLDKNVESSTKNFKIQIENQKAFISDLKKHISSVEREISRVSSDSEKKKLIPSLLEAERELKSAEQSLSELDAQVSGTSGKQAQLRTQIMNLKNEMAKMTEGTDEYRAAMERLGEMQDRYGDITQQGRVLADDEKYIRATADAVAGLSGAMSAGIGIASLFGAGEENLVKIQAKLQAVMATTIGLQQVAQTLNKDSYFSIVLLAGAKKKWAAAQELLNTQLKIGAVASKALMISGIGILIAGITALVVAYDKWKKKQDEIKEQNEKLKKLHEDAAKNIEGEVEKLQELERVASDTNRTQSERIKALNTLNQLMPSYNGYLDKETGLLVANKDALIEYIQALANMEVAKNIAMENAKRTILIAESQQLEKDYATGKAAAPKKYSALGQYVGGSNVSPGTYIEPSADAIKKANEANIQAAIESERKKQEELKKENEKGETLIKELTKNNVKLLSDLNSSSTVSASKPENRLSEMRIDALRKIKEEEISLMKEGEEKRKAQAELEYKNRLDEIAKEKSEYDKHVKELQKAGVPVSQAEIKGYNDLSMQQALQAKQKYDEQIRQIDSQTAENYASIQNELKLNFESRLNQQLADIDGYYNDLSKKAEGNSKLLEQIESARNKAKMNATNEAKLREIDLAEAMAMQKAKVATSEINMSEYAERKKNEILIEYASQRIEILKKIGDEQAKMEIGQLETSISLLQKQNSRQLSLKGRVDDKAIKSLILHFEKLGDSEETATEKAEAFFTEFQGKMQLAADVTDLLKNVFGGIDESTDAILDAVGNIASGFARGGIAGGIEAATSQLISAGTKWLTAKKEIDEETIKQYESYLSGMNELIDKQISMLDRLGGDRFGANILKTVADLHKSMIASRNLLSEAMKEGAGTFSHSEGYKANRVLRGYASELRSVGILTTDLSKMTNEQLILLKAMPEIYSRLSENMRKYIDDLAESSEKLEDFKQQVQDAVLGFDFSGITAMIVDSLTDNSIDNALDQLTNNVNGEIAKMVKNMLSRQMLVEPVKRMTEELFKSMDKGSGKYELDIDAAKIFTEGVKTLGEQYGREFDKLKEQFASAGIDFDSALSGNGSRSSVSKGIAQASQESIDENNGRLTNIQMTLAKVEQNQFELSVFIFKIFDPINRIADNTDRLEAIELSMESVKTDIAKMARDGILMKR